MSKYDVSLEHEGEKLSVLNLTRMTTWPDQKTWTHGELLLEVDADIRIGGYATLVLEPVENLPTDRVPVVLPCGVGRRGVKVPYKVLSRTTGKPLEKKLSAATRAAIFGALYGARGIE